MIYLPWPFKSCNKCGNDYLLPNKQTFPTRSPLSRERLYSYCKECAREYDRKWRSTHTEYTHEYNRTYNENHKAELRIYNQEWQLAHKVEERERKREKYAQNIEEERNKARQRYKDNQDYHKEYAKTHRSKFPEKARYYNKRRLARKRSLLSTFTTVDWEFALSYFNGVCAYCGNPPGLFDKNWILHQDHYLPQSKGNGYTPDNIVPACQSCNFSKGARDPEEWIVWKFGKRNAKKIMERIHDYFEAVKARGR